MTPVTEPGLGEAVRHDHDLDDHDLDDHDLDDHDLDDHDLDDHDLDDAVARLSVALGRLVRVMRRDGPTGLGPGSISALATLVRCGPMRLGDLATREGVAPPTLTRIVVGLEDSGYVVRAADPDDRRATRVQSTPAAVELMAGVGSARLTQLRARVDALAADELRALVRALPAIERLAADDG